MLQEAFRLPTAKTSIYYISDIKSRVIEAGDPVIPVKQARPKVNYCCRNLTLYPNLTS